ncbi:2,4-dienoyl-CoA reductase-like NADH-dependent reductase (Old Yellow Enzyme family) [Sphingobium boeckii]|uniref:2,4-dienoyl-CoA reductase-like NADH-dependent reductase (Old Yellow Enzyme family) n=1 Tax=Sphingobium boeckii TaxID=1082345 RepID=A0A7W9AFQ3_9SPHN|nr:hypothetical protein [Sphingobium boeckii]MBB5684794.1 2,4-dienoyl-CoA reductase-like NADH-dependent reductase (Old Yellow Enzyme family) [Sphingobium boeckii]
MTLNNAMFNTPWSPAHQSQGRVQTWVTSQWKLLASPRHFSAAINTQIAGWRQVIEAVHAEGGVIFAQLWHVGRVSHAQLQPDGEAPIAPSAIQAQRVKAFLETGRGTGTLVEPSLPRALTMAEIGELVALYAQAARNAMTAGFDGVGIHSANGHLVNQFISADANTRTDAYGGSLDNRPRSCVRSWRQ